MEQILDRLKIQVVVCSYIKHTPGLGVLPPDSSLVSLHHWHISVSTKFLPRFFPLASLFSFYSYKCEQTVWK